MVLMTFSTIWRYLIWAFVQLFILCVSPTPEQKLHDIIDGVLIIAESSAPRILPRSQ